MDEQAFQYVRIAEELKKAIAVQGHNSIMPSEVALAHRFGVSRVTIRRSLEILENHGVLSRQHGRGTIANPFKCVRNLIPARPFEQDLAEQGVEFTTSTISFSAIAEIPSPIRVGVENCPEEAGRILLVHSTLSNPLSCEERFFSTRLIGEVTEKDFAGEPFERAIKRISGRDIDRLVVNTEIHPATADIGRLLRIKTGTLVLSNYYCRYVEDGLPLDFGLISYRLDICRFRISVESGKDALDRDIPVST